MRGIDATQFFGTGMHVHAVRDHLAEDARCGERRGRRARGDLGPVDGRGAHAQDAGTDRSASTIFESRSVTRGPHREAMSSSRATTRPFFTAAIVEYPGRADTVAALWPQHLVSARKMKFGFEATTYSADNCGYPPDDAAPFALSAMSSQSGAAPTLSGTPRRRRWTLAVAGAACSYAVSALVQRRRLRGVSPLQVGFWQLALTAPLALAAALPTVGATHLHLASIAAMLFLGVGGSGIAFLLYYFMMNTLGATRATTVTFLLPVTAVFWGASLLRETITISILAGMVVILLGVFLTSRPRRPAAVTADRGVA